MKRLKCSCGSVFSYVMPFISSRGVGMKGVGCACGSPYTTCIVLNKKTKEYELLKTCIDTVNKRMKP